MSSIRPPERPAPEGAGGPDGFERVWMPCRMAYIKAAHLHQHVVPRGGGDTNVMPVVGRTKVLPSY